MRRKVISLSVVFIVLIACFALLSRAVSASGVADVRVATASSQTITRRIDAEGVLSHRREEAVLVEAGQVISAIQVEEGRKVEAGAPLFNIDGGVLQDQINEGDAEVRKIDLQIMEAREIKSESGINTTLSALYIDRNLAQARLDRLIVLRDRGCAVSAPFAGTITSIKTSIGDVTSPSAVLLMSNESDGYALEASLPADEAKDIVGKELAAGITLADGTKLDEVPLSANLSEDGTTVLVRGVMPEGDFSYSSGGRVQVDIVVSSADYQKCLPAECVYQEGSRAYVYVVTDVSSLTGTEQGVQKRYVSVLDSDRIITAVDDSSVTMDQKVVVRSDRVIDKNTRVRIVE